MHTYIHMLMYVRYDVCSFLVRLIRRQTTVSFFPQSCSLTLCLSQVYRALPESGSGAKEPQTADLGTQAGRGRILEET